jgi:hypothetical protein
MRIVVPTTNGQAVVWFSVAVIIGGLAWFISQQPNLSRSEAHKPCEASKMCRDYSKARQN